MSMSAQEESLAPFFLRLGIGGIFLFHGSAKLFFMRDGMAQFFQQVGLPASFSLVVGLLEVVGALALIAGFGTRIASAVLSVILVGAIVKVKWALGFVTPQGLPGWEFDLALLAATVSLIFSGAGRHSLEEALQAKSV